MKKRELYAALEEVQGKSHKIKTLHLINFILKVHPAWKKEVLKKPVENFVSLVNSKMARCRRNRPYFLNAWKDWLDADFEFTETTSVPSSGRKRGRPSKPFEALSTRSKARRVKQVGNTTQELVHAAASSMFSEGQRSASNFMKEVFSSSPGRPQRVQEAWEQSQSGKNTPKVLSPEEALNTVVEANLTKSQYQLLRTGAQAHNAPIYPSYDVVLAGKNECYPTGIISNEKFAVVPLQSLLDKTTSRLLSFLSGGSLEGLGTKVHLVFIFKWGCDGSSGFTMFKQTSIDPSLNDTHLFVTSVVYLQLYQKGEGAQKKIVWQNPRTSSHRYCRPLKLEFGKETEELILATTRSVKEEISKLQEFRGKFGNVEVHVKYEMHMTMVDVKVCNIVSEQKSSRSCFICLALPSEMNNIEKLSKRIPNPETYTLGMSSLHAWIRSFEYLLHISFRLVVHPRPKPRARLTAVESLKTEDRKKEIQENFKLKLGLSVDKPKQGFGNTNDGNTARAFFKNPAVTAEITGLDSTLLNRFRVILTTLSSGYEIDVHKYGVYAKETGKMCLDLYGWYDITPTVHKVLWHGAEIIKAAPLPIGMMSEDAQELNHKRLKYIRLAHTRKHDRTACNLDMLHACLVASDPVITSMRKLPKSASSRQTLCQEVIGLLREPDLTFSPEAELDSDFEED